ncbi:TolB-like translocation protein [Psychroserpens damuponensis]|uniref:PD40 domain-containing protein n=1 Tax=Psychroserpens damuponensis TaxID=943936 RepID=UPI0005908AC9|nr:PD40 domain-containing protein [Psychroserpens damuponensis]
MKPLILITFSLFLISCNNTQHIKTASKEVPTNSEITFKKGTVVPVAPALFSQFTNVRDFTITPQENEAYFTILSPLGELSVIMRIQKENNAWNEPKIASFSGRYTDLEPFLSPDGLKLYFASNRPISKDSTTVKDFDIWYVEREKINSKWSQPINIGAPVNSSYDEFYPSITQSNNIYFTAIKDGMNGQDDIFKSEWNNNGYEAPKALGTGVNTKGAEFNAFVAPDESYILFSGWRRKDGVGSADLYISTYKNDEWQPATNLGVEINSKYIDYCPFVNTETGTLYFTSRKSNIDKKENGYFKFDELMTEINRYDNGSSRIYMTDLNSLISVSD